MLLSHLCFFITVFVWIIGCNELRCLGQVLIIIVVRCYLWFCERRRCWLLLCELLFGLNVELAVEGIHITDLVGKELFEIAHLIGDSWCT